MPHLRVVQPVDDTSSLVDGGPRVSLRLLMAASGRCSCDDCLLAYRAGNRRAGIIQVRDSAPSRLRLSIAR
ncbi:MAG: hypothetical protein QOC82_3158 [Frankiaceae bacterium]|nr:hypothetical protein [Frankiaceae bacterium]